MLNTLAFFNFTPLELLIVLGVGLLIFGRRLPEVGRSLGKGIVEFKKGLAGVEEDVGKAGPGAPPAPSTGQTALPPQAEQPKQLAPPPAATSVQEQEEEDPGVLAAEVELREAELKAAQARLAAAKQKSKQ